MFSPSGAVFGPDSLFLPFHISPMNHLYRFVFWAGYAAVLGTSLVSIPWSLDKIRLGTPAFHIRLDHLLHLSVYLLICIFFTVGRKLQLTLFQNREVKKFFILILLLATVSEGIQLWVPLRSFNPADWLANVAGIGLGAAVFWMGGGIMISIKK
jgi:VanZ family protein